MLHVILQTAVSCDIDIFRCLHFHMSGHSHPTSSEAVSQWSGGNPGFLGPAGRMLILTWIHTHTDTHTYMLTKKVILVAESCGVWFVFCSFTGNRYVCACGLTAFPFSSLQSECGDGGGVIWHD